MCLQLSNFNDRASISACLGSASYRRPGSEPWIASQVPVMLEIHGGEQYAQAKGEWTLLDARSKQAWAARCGLTTMARAWSKRVPTQGPVLQLKTAAEKAWAGPRWSADGGTELLVSWVALIHCLQRAELQPGTYKPYTLAFYEWSSDLLQTKGESDALTKLRTVLAKDTDTLTVLTIFNNEIMNRVLSLEWSSLGIHGHCRQCGQGLLSKPMIAEKSRDGVQQMWYRQHLRNCGGENEFKAPQMLLLTYEDAEQVSVASLVRLQLASTTDGLDESMMLFHLIIKAGDRYINVFRGRDGVLETLQAARRLNADSKVRPVLALYCKRDRTEAKTATMARQGAPAAEKVRKLTVEVPSVESKDAGKERGSRSGAWAAGPEMNWSKTEKVFWFDDLSPTSVTAKTQCQAALQVLLAQGPFKHGKKKIAQWWHETLDHAYRLAEKYEDLSEGVQQRLRFYSGGEEAAREKFERKHDNMRRAMSLEARTEEDKESMKKEKRARRNQKRVERRDRERLAKRKAGEAAIEGQQADMEGSVK